MTRRDCLLLHARPKVADDGNRVYPSKAAKRVQQLARQGYRAATELASYRVGDTNDPQDMLLWLWKGRPGATQSDS